MVAFLIILVEDMKKDLLEVIKINMQFWSLPKLYSSLDAQPELQILNWLYLI